MKVGVLPTEVEGTMPPFSRMQTVHDADVHLSQETVTELLGDLAEVDIREHGIARVDLLVDVFPRLVGVSPGYDVLPLKLVEFHADGSARA